MKNGESATISPLVTKVARELAPVRNRKLLVAVSGGADSIALLHLLLEAGYRNLVVAHFNHQLRGAASRADAAFVARLATKHHLPFELGSVDVKKAAKEQKLSTETAARQTRYAFLATVAGKHRTKSLLLAHHADDQVETCLFQFFRGSGAAGLAGMKPRSQRRIEGVTLDLYRPLLFIPKQQLLNYLNERNLRHREDASNAVANASRNKLRLKLLPLIEELLGPSFRGSIVRNSAIFADEEDFLSGLALPMAAPEKLSVKILKALHPAIRRRVIHAWLKNHAIDEPGFVEVERVAALLDHSGPAKINLPGNHHARRRSGVLFLENPKIKTNP